jgi:hypothetical protein
MAITRVKDPDFWSLLGESVGQTGAGALEGWMEGQKIAQNKNKLNLLRSSLVSQYGMPESVISNLDPKTLEDIAQYQINVRPQKEAELAAKQARDAGKLSSKQEKELKKLEETQAGAERLAGKIGRAKDLFKDLRFYETTLPGTMSSSAYISLKDTLRGIEKDPYFKKMGGIPISIEAGEAIPSSLDELEKQIYDFYKLKAKEENQQKGEGQPEGNTLPAELKQPRSVQQQDMMPQSITDMIPEWLQRTLSTVGQAGLALTPPVAGSNIVKGV